MKEKKKEHSNNNKEIKLIKTIDNSINKKKGKFPNRYVKVIFFLILFLYDYFTYKRDYSFSIDSTKHIYNDREQWVDLAYKIAAPVLENMSKGLLKRNMITEYSPIFDKRDKSVLYMECFGRLMDGIAPWLSLPEDETKEGKLRKKLHKWALLSYKNAVDENNPDFLLWEGNNTRQPLVDAAYLAQSFLRAPESTWEKLDENTRKKYIEVFEKIRKIEPYNSNWLLFSGIIECFFIMAGKEPNKTRMYDIVNRTNNFYLGDGWYSDGPNFDMNYYNSFVIHPMLIEILETMENNNIEVPISSKLAIERMQQFNVFMERLISPEGTFPAFGRSIVYRMAAFQTLALSAWKYSLPMNLTYGGIRNALTKVLNNMFKVKENFNEGGFLTLGFVGHQPYISDRYSNNGSTYITALIFLVLGLPSNHEFWTEPPKPWTSIKAWNGNPFPIFEHRNLKQ